MCAASSLIFTRIGMSNLSKYKVTVVIVNYNKEPYISQCIESVINQSLQPIEIIIVDDGSTDNSGIISSRYAVAHPHVRYLTQENKGVSSARNKGFPAVRHISTHKELHLTPSASNKLFKKIFLFSIAFLLMKTYMLVKICYL